PHHGPDLVKATSGSMDRARSASGSSRSANAATTKPLAIEYTTSIAAQPRPSHSAVDTSRPATATAPTRTSSSRGPEEAITAFWAVSWWRVTRIATSATGPRSTRAIDQPAAPTPMAAGIGSWPAITKASPNATGTASRSGVASARVDLMRADHGPRSRKGENAG